MANPPLSASIQKYLVPWTGLEWPIDWCGVFGRTGDLVVEIGFGNGAFLTDLAQRHSDRLFVGIERAWGSIHRLFSRLETAGVEQVRAVEADAAFALEHLFGPQSISEIYINFPDPWHKERHHHRRLIQPAFVQALTERLRPGGMVILATDQAEYAGWIAGIFEAQTRLQSVFPSTFVHNVPGRYPTKYEQKALSSGVPVHYFVFRLDAFVRVDRQNEKVGEMPNVILKGEYDPDGLLRGFEPRVWQETSSGVPVVIKFLELYSRLPDGHRLIAALVREGELVQYFCISVVMRTRGELLVKLAPFGQPRPTWGVKQAVSRAVALVRQGNPGLQVISSTLGR